MRVRLARVKNHVKEVGKLTGGSSIGSILKSVAGDNANGTESRNNSCFSATNKRVGDGEERTMGKCWDDQLYTNGSGQSASWA